MQNNTLSFNTLYERDEFEADLIAKGYRKVTAAIPFAVKLNPYEYVLNKASINPNDFGGPEQYQIIYCSPS